jgi:long-chain acyl-CoA synthetase
VISGNFNPNFSLRISPFSFSHKSVPAVWESIRKSIEGKIAESSLVVRATFWGSVWIKDKMISYGIPGTSLFDALVFNKVKEVTGGHIFWSIYGGSGLSEGTQRFVCASICPMASGYGLTETCAYILPRAQLIVRMGCISSPGSWAYAAVGPVVTSIEAKLVDVPELGYFTSNTPPRGEVWLRGPSITSGYLNRDQETEQLFDKDGWLKTGDIGEFDNQGMLKLIDRVKNLVKTLNGEYIAIEKVHESTLMKAKSSLKRRIALATWCSLSVYMSIPIRSSQLRSWYL